MALLRGAWLCGAEPSPKRRSPISLVVFTNTRGSARSDAPSVTVMEACLADFNHDWLVEDADFVLFVGAYNLLLGTDPAMPASCPADLNSDGLVEDGEFVSVVNACAALIRP